MAKKPYNPIVVVTPGVELRGFNNGEPDQDGIWHGKCPRCGDYHEFKYHRGIFVKICQKCATETQQMEKAQKILNKKPRKKH